MSVLRLRGGAGKVLHLADLGSLNGTINSNKDKLVVIDFTASWCGPCQRVAPKFVDMSEKYQNVVFVKVDVDEAPDCAEAFDVNCMPTFVFLKGGNKVHRIEGADLNGIVSSIEKYQ